MDRPMVVCAWILCAGLLLPYAVSEDVLKFVHIVYRHGDRTPEKFLPKDVNNTKSTWYQGKGELTPAGMRRHYQLGLWFRQRYATFLNDTFDQTQIYVRSTDFKRTIMSAMCNLAGLYPPKGEQKWNTNINWQPIPVHAMKTKHDYMLRHHTCERVKELEREILTGAQWIKLERENAPFLEFLNINTGLNTKYYNLELERIGKVYDPISIEYWTRKDRMMPWINDSIVQQIFDLYDLRVRYYKYEHATIKRLRGGPLLGDIVERMEQKRESTLDHRLKIYFYSGHDSTLIAFLKAMVTEVHSQVPFTSAVIVELYQSTDTGQWTVRAFMKNDTGEMDMGAVMPHELQVSGCPPASPCPFGQFIKRSHPFIPVDWSAECESGATPPPPRGTKATKGTHIASLKVTETPRGSTAGHTNVLTATMTTDVNIEISDEPSSPEEFIVLGVLIGICAMLLFFTLLAICVCLRNGNHTTRKPLENEPELGTAGKCDPKAGPTNDKMFENKSSVLTPVKDLTPSKSQSTQDSSGVLSPSIETSSESPEEGRDI